MLCTRHTSSSRQVKGLWESLYRAINLTNLFIEKLNTETFEQSKYDQLIAEAKFLRAHSYFLLTSWYNEVPLALTPTEDQSSNHLPASSLEEVYAQIISDYSFAAENLLVAADESYTKGRVHKMAAHGLLARVYLKIAGYPLQDTEKYALAKEQCEIVIADGYHGLNTAEGNGYRNHFLSYIKNIYDTRESLFEISFSYLREQGLITDGRIGESNGVPFDYGGGNKGYPTAYAAFNASPIMKTIYNKEDDLRYKWNIAGFQYTRGGDVQEVTNTLQRGYCPGKFRRWEPANFDDLLVKALPGVPEPYILLEAVTSPVKNFTGINFPVLRYSDILLMYAEAANEVEGGPSSLTILNTFRFSEISIFLI